MSAKRGMSQIGDMPPLHPEGTLFKPGETGTAYGNAPS
jgi:hypothetical protein